MKKLIYIFLVLFLFGCEYIIDEKRELNALDSDLIFENEEMANLFLNKAYQQALPGFKMTSNTNISDETTGSGTGNMMYGLLTKEDTYGNYKQYWTNIRRINFILNELKKGSLDPDALALMRGQAFFLRGWMYWEMVKYYGGVPLITEVIDIQDSTKRMNPRSSAQECVNLIVSDLDSAVNLLPTSWSAEYGRATRAAAAALKGRVLLFYASPQFNPQNDGQRWQAAYEANLAAKDMAETDGHALYNNFENIFIDEDFSTEAIFLVRFDEDTKYHSYEDNVRPRSVSNSSNPVSCTPNWDFVKSFPMKDGFPIGESPNYSYDQDNFWKNRDPRLDATVAYNGMSWEFADAESGRIQWTFSGNKTDAGANASVTGFYLKKNINTSIPIILTGKTPTDWIEIRLAEVYLNLAECAAETGNDDVAIDMLKRIRERAGIEDKDGKYGIDTDNLVEAVMLERKIELAFEDKRHWDMKRRNMFIEGLGSTQKLNGQIRHGIQTSIDTAYIFSLDAGIHYRYDTTVTPTQTVIQVLNPDTAIVHFLGVIMDTLENISDKHNLYFDIEFDTELDPEPINFLQPEYNFIFIPENDMLRNWNLRQTIYWTTVDPFDPLSN